MDESSPLLSSSDRCTGESDEEYKSRWRSIRVLYFTNFLGAVGFSVVMPSVWPFLQVIDPGVQTSFLGIIIGAYSLGQFLASPILGWMSNRMNRSGPPLLLGLGFQITGNLGWAYLQDLPTSHGYTMAAARIFIGVGAATMAVIRSYVSKATTLKERTGVNAVISACQALGFSIGPALQAALVPLGYPGPVETKGFHLNLYTAPGWLGALFSIANFLAILLVFREHFIHDDPLVFVANISSNDVDEVNQETDDSIEVYQTTAENTRVTCRPDYLVVWSLLVVFFFILFIFVMFETMSTPLSMYEYGWSKEKAILYNGLIWASTGIITIVIVMLVRGPGKKLSERRLLAVGFFILMCGLIVYLPYGGSRPPIKWVNSTSNSSDVGGCPSNLTWCFELPQIHLAQLLGATFLLSISYPTVNLLVYTTYSKVLGPIPQGLWMGLFTSSGSLARMLGPLYVGAMLEKFGPRWTLLTGGLMALVSFITIVGMYKRIIPYQERVNKLTPTEPNQA